MAEDLLSFVKALGHDEGMRVEESLGDGFVRLRVSEAERRQAKHDIRCVEDAVIELLRNARDAHARHIFLASSKEGALRTLWILDDGDGIPPHLHERVFDARVTSKLDSMHEDSWGVHGRGMALFSIRQNAVEARVAASEVGCGCAIKVVFDTERITERADQYSWPEVHGTRSERSFKGPRNILRACCEFGFATEGLCNVYVGSPSEMLACVRVRVRPQAAMLFGDGQDTRARLVDRVVLAPDARALCGVAEELGLDLSERTCHRIVRGLIAPVKNVRIACSAPEQSKQALRGSESSTPSFSTMQHAASLAHMSDADMREMQEALDAAFSRIAERYYMELDEPVRLSFSGQTVHAAFSVRDSTEDEG